MPAPPLSALRVFEAAARHASFARAAAELHVTPAAVSQQMRALEDRLGVKLFVRGARGLTVTGPGREYATGIARALADIEASTRALGRPERSGRLAVATFHSFASMWLLPRLGRFRARYPEIDIRLVVGSTLVDLADGNIDVAIRFGSGDYPGCDAQFLMADGVIPVCAPSLLAGRPVPRWVGDFADLPLLHDDGLAPGERRLTWADWLEDKPSQTSIHMPDGLLTLQAALLGEGVALARRSMVADHLQAGRLVRLLEEERATDFNYWLVTAPGEQAFRVTTFIDWMHSEAGVEAADAG